MQPEGRGQEGAAGHVAVLSEHHGCVLRGSTWLYAPSNLLCTGKTGCPVVVWGVFVGNGTVLSLVSQRYC
jgi:hypothetical protein